MTIRVDRRLRRALALGGLVTLIVAGMWWGNTRAVEFNVDSPAAAAAAPGSVLSVLTDRPCTPIAEVLYRPSAFGRWQQTHVHGEAARRRWYDIHSQEVAVNAECALGPWTITIPPDVEGDRIAACGLASDLCVEIRVDRAD